METKLVHPFLWRSHQLNGKDGLEILIDGTHKLSTYCNKLVQQSNLYPNRYEPEKYRGDGFELLIEALIKLSPADNRIGLNNYQPVTNNDTGVDGFGIGLDGKPATVQIKFRSDSEYLLTVNKDHLGNFVMASISTKYNVDLKSKKNMFIYTNAAGLHYYTDVEMFKNQGYNITCYGHETLKRWLDNNHLFWNNFRSLIKESK